MLGWEYPPQNSGGLGEACMGLTKALAKKEVDITFVLPKKVDVQADHMQIVFANLEDQLDMIYPAYTTDGGRFKKYVTSTDVPPDFVRGALAFAERIEAIAKKYKSDLVHSHDWMTYPAGIAAKGVTGKPMVAHVHSTECDRTGNNFPNQVVHRIEGDGVKSADRVITVSNLTKRIVGAEYGIDPGKIDVVYNGIDTFSKAKLPAALSHLKDMGYKIVLFLGRITLQKGPEYFVRSAKQVLEYEPKTIFLVVGSGDMQGQMMSEAAENGVSDKFIFTGFLRGQEKDRIYQASDVYVMPSVSEPFGITSLEAVANETCVLASKQSGVSEVLTHILKVDFWDTAEMANKIVALLRYPALQWDLKNNSKGELKGVNWERAAEKTMSVYKQLL